MQILHILKQLLHILKVEGKRTQTKTRFQSAKRERLRKKIAKSRGEKGCAWGYTLEYFLVHVGKITSTRRRNY